MNRRGILRTSVVLALACIAVPAIGGADAPAAFKTGVQDYEFPRAGMSTSSAAALLAPTGASVKRASITWRETAPTRPANGADPNDPAYRWTKFDEIVRIAEAMGGEALLSTYEAPVWAEGPNRPTTGYGPCWTKQAAGTMPPCPGSWRPDPIAFGNFGRALAKRYDGNTTDPLQPSRKLPRVRLFEAWNEPNYKMYLAPQCSKGTITRDSKCTSGGTVVAVSWYRQMLNAFYDGVKASQPGALVSSGGVGPYGASSQGFEIEPQYFARSLMCLGGTPSAPTAVPASSCPTKAKMDALSFHPYTVVNTPTTKAWSRDGAALGNTGEVRRALDTAISKRTILPAGQKELWATELGWFTCPPCDPANRGLSLRTAASYTAEMLYRLWANRVSIAVWFAPVDGACFAPNCNYSNWPGGLYFRNNALTGANPKPGLQAFRFPLFAMKSGSKAFAWTRSPCRNPGARVTFQALSSRSGGLTPVATATLGSGTDGVIKTGNWTIPANTKDIRASVTGAGCTAETSIAMPVAAR